MTRRARSTSLPLLAWSSDLLLHRERLTIELRRHPDAPSGRTAAWVAAGWVAASDHDPGRALHLTSRTADQPRRGRARRAVLAPLAVRRAGRFALGIPEADAAGIDAAILEALGDEGTPSSTAMLAAAWEALDAQNVYPESQDVRLYISELLG